MGGGYFEFNEPRASSSTEQNKIEPENVSSTEEEGVVKPSTNFPIVDLKDYDIAEKMIHYILVSHLFENPKTKNIEAEGNLKEAEFDFKIDLKNVIPRTSVDLKLSHPKICVRNQQKERAPEELAGFQQNYRTIPFVICR